MWQKQKQEVHWFMSTWTGGRARWKWSRRCARLSVGHLVALLYGLPSSVLPFRTPTHTHTHTLRHERVDLINQCNLSTVHLKSVVCFRGTRHFFYLNTNSPHTRPATIQKLTRILSVRRGGLVQLLINTVKTSPRPHTLPKYSYCIPCNSIWEL